MNKQLFTRTISKGQLICQIDGTKIRFTLDGQEVKERSIAFINTVDELKDKKFATEIYQKLKAIGANAVWNYQVALFNNEADIIDATVKQALKEKEEAEEQIIRDTDIIVTKTLYNGAPANAENNKFEWFHGQQDFLICKKSGRSIYQMAYMRKSEFGSDNITDEETKADVCSFWNDLSLIQKFAEKEYSRKKTEKEKLENAQRGENPWTKGLSHEEIKLKAKEWDNINNEGGEGYNPYYHW